MSNLANETTDFKIVESNENIPVFLGFMKKTTENMIYAAQSSYYGESQLFVFRKFHKPISSIFH